MTAFDYVYVGALLVFGGSVLGLGFATWLFTE
jgi:hypothetical protein